MKRLLPIVSIGALALLISGCQNPNVPQKVTVDPTLPQITELKTLADITEVGFEWEPVHDLKVEGYHLYRAAGNNNGSLERVGTINDRYVSHYVDTKLSPQTGYVYSLSTYNKDKRESVPSALVRVVTKPTIEPVPFVQAMMGLPSRIKVIWRPHPSERVSAYIIERNDFGSTKWEQLATVSGRLSAEYIDAGLKENKSYRYRVRAKTYDGIISAASQIVEAQTKTLPPPVSNIKTTRDLPKKIVLTWDASTYPDAVSYNIYRASMANLFYSHIVKTKNTRYEDLVQEDGASRHYYITVVDKDGLESPRQSAAVVGATLEVPLAPAVNVIKEDGRSVMMGWKDGSGRGVKYQVVRTAKGGGILTYTGIPSNTFVDQDIVQCVEYVYTVFTVDANGLISKPSEKAIIIVPKR
ncbi:MAG: hypothetical protein LBS73_04330 [Campylobacteraceae bacterium]|nr:hypothetical protein [Campylobacteraceae bacterium]